ncbi:cytochrome P450 [Mumia sp. DW29H23]|uniref:cytochrome P450 n=1 Tax=Mumia sp. DW29H23 TaxID=3421241 RepID=UPI003D68F824
MTATVMEKVRDQARFGLLDHSAQLLAAGYPFWDRQRRSNGSEVVRTRVMGRRVTCLRGEDGARFFYETSGLRRKGALPPPIVASLFGKAAVHTLDGPSHRRRKHGFATLLDSAAAFAIAQDVGRGWEAAVRGRTGTVDLFEEVARLQLAAVCRWAGVEVDDLDARAADMVAMVDGFGSVGRRQVRARLARRRAERWMLPQVRAARATETAAPLGEVARWRGDDGVLLPLEVATVEALNVVRPTVAVAWFAAATARALALWPQVRSGIRSGDLDPLWVAQEVRRHGRFAPFLGSVATEDLAYREHEIPKGSLVVLDLWGTDHDPRLWDDPDAFRPERFARRDVGPYELVPQGGGDRERGHRCPGEDVTLACLTLLVPRIAEDVPVVLETGVASRRMPPEPRCAVLVGLPGSGGGGKDPKTEPGGDDPVTDPGTDPRTNPGAPRPNEPYPSDPGEPGPAPGDNDDERNT